jgi:hypothetical protein
MNRGQSSGTPIRKNWASCQSNLLLKRHCNLSFLKQALKANKEPFLENLKIKDADRKEKKKAKRKQNLPSSIHKKIIPITGKTTTNPNKEVTKEQQFKDKIKASKEQHNTQKAQIDNHSILTNKNQRKNATPVFYIKTRNKLGLTLRKIKRSTIAFG